MRDFDGELITQRKQWGPDHDPVDPAQWGIECFESTHANGLCTKEGTIHTGSNSGYAAINVALHKGFKRIILIGFDMSMDGEKRHFFGDHPKPLNFVSNYNTFIDCFRTINPKDYGLEIWNCSRRSALEHFPRYDLDSCLELL